MSFAFEPEMGRRGRFSGKPAAFSLDRKKAIPFRIFIRH
jgi:hypothetical protein